MPEKPSFNKVVQEVRASNNEMLVSLEKVEEALTLLGEAGLTRTAYPDVHVAIARAISDMTKKERERILKEAGG